MVCSRLLSFFLVSPRAGPAGAAPPAPDGPAFALPGGMMASGRDGRVEAHELASEANFLVVTFRLN